MSEEDYNDYDPELYADYGIKRLTRNAYAKSLEQSRANTKRMQEEQGGKTEYSAREINPALVPNEALDNSLPPLEEVEALLDEYMDKDSQIDEIKIKQKKRIGLNSAEQLVPEISTSLFLRRVELYAFFQEHRAQMLEKLGYSRLYEIFEEFNQAKYNK